MAHRTGVCEGGKRKNCVTHSQSVFRMVVCVANPVCVLTW